jgi:antitoxin component of MazEF toxin-antitoxin module
MLNTYLGNGLLFCASLLTDRLYWRQNNVDTRKTMVKHMSRIGNSLGLIIDRPILDLLKIDEHTPLEVSTDGNGLTIRPMHEPKPARVAKAARRVMKAHEATLRKLAK